jgi:plasmid maintenance system antidote protein VapI
MKQANSIINEMSKNQLNRLVTMNFLEIVEEIVSKRLYTEITTESELASYIELNQAYISKLKSNENRYVSFDMMLRLVNILGANSNNFFLLKKSEREQLIREGFTVNAGRSGNTNNISNSKIGKFIQGAIINGDNHKGDIHTTMKIINGLPNKQHRKEMKDFVEKVTNQNSGLKNEVGDLKKTLARHEKAIKEKNDELKEKNEELRAKEKQLFEVSQKYIALLEEGKVAEKK